MKAPNAPRHVRQALANGSAVEILGTCSCAKSKTRLLHVRQQLQRGVRCTKKLTNEVDTKRAAEEKSSDAEGSQQIGTGGGR